VKFQITFETMVVFSTNLDPQDLADEAFLRRIQNKIFVDVVSAETFDEIFRRVVAERNLACAEGVGEYFREMCIRLNNELRACYAADFCNIMQSVGEYESREMKITPVELERAAQLYFTKTKKFVDK
jgi:hypothetical protein